ncbi:MAG: 5-(carboxyamino)imidazole ribonucleotide synthase [Gammaproteobacteria bacterium]|nr:5-(carboxyamino)imidazole ribonucleotide synthase [Gammaproteobacteria bacterium]
MNRIIAPGAVLGVLGGGQLGRMFAIAARRLGYRVHVLSPADDTPTGQIADVEVNAAYDDLDAIARFARNVAALTFEFENVPADTVEVASRYTPVRPAGQVLHVAQNRLREKSFLRDAGLPVTPFIAIRSAADLDSALQQMGCPAVLKTAAWGYDGKGQVRIERGADTGSAWAALATGEAILEQYIEFEREVSVIAARGLDGTCVDYGVIANSHRHHILDISVAPAPVDANVASAAREIARTVLEALDVVGVLCVEFFVTPDGTLMINEIAPRPHNSGHLSIDACVTCQFEQQVRAVCGLPLGDPALLRPAAMANLLGDLWTPGPPAFDRALALNDVKLHLYGKTSALPGRKMGHLTALADTPEAAMCRVIAARAALTGPS